MSDNKKVIRVSADVEKLIRQHAKDRELTVGDAADALVSTGFSRLQALAAYAEKGRAKKATAEKKPRVRKAKKAPEATATE